MRLEESYQARVMVTYIIEHELQEEIKALDPAKKKLLLNKPNIDVV